MIIKTSTTSGLPLNFSRLGTQDNAMMFGMTIHSKDNKRQLDSHKLLRLTFGSIIKWYEIESYIPVELDRLSSVGAENLYRSLREEEKMK